MRLAQGRKAKPNANTRKPSPDKCLVVPSLSPGLRPHCPRNTGANAVTTREGLRRSVAFLEDGTDGFPPLRSRVVIIPRLAPRLHLQQHGQFRHRQKVSTLPPLKQYLTRATHVTKVESKYYVLCSLAHSLRFDNIMAKAKFSAIRPKGSWLYPISQRGKRFFVLENGEEYPVSIDTYKMLVEDGRLSQDERWGLHTNFHQIRRRDEVFIYTGDHNTVNPLQIAALIVHSPYRQN